MSVGNRLKHAWNAFLNIDTDRTLGYTRGGYGGRPDRVRLNVSNERSILASIIVRMSVDVSGVEFRHVKLDDQGRYSEDVNSGLQNCLTVEANVDQAATMFKQDIALTLYDKGVVAVVPTDATIDPKVSGSYDIDKMRVGEIVDWAPSKIKVSLYNEATGRREELWLDKSYVAVIENPLYAIMNEPNSTLQRLIRKLNLLDSVDEQMASGKLDLIIQLPYAVKSETRRQQAEQRRAEIEFQLKGSQYGIAYTDGTEKITQLNRPAENNLLTQVESLISMLYTQLGVTPEIMNGTADETAMLNYMNRVINPVVVAITEEFKRKFLTKTARTQGHSVMYFRDPFKIIPLSAIAEIADKLARNEVTSSNEIRSWIGLKPDKSPKSDELRNSNMPQSELGTPPPQTKSQSVDTSKIAAEVMRKFMPNSTAGSVGVGNRSNRLKKGDSQNGS